MDFWGETNHISDPIHDAPQKNKWERYALK